MLNINTIYELSTFIHVVASNILFFPGGPHEPTLLFFFSMDILHFYLHLTPDTYV